MPEKMTMVRVNMKTLRDYVRYVPELTDLLDNGKRQSLVNIMLRRAVETVAKGKAKAAVPNVQ